MILSWITDFPIGAHWKIAKVSWQQKRRNAMNTKYGKDYEKKMKEKKEKKLQVFTCTDCGDDIDWCKPCYPYEEEDKPVCANCYEDHMRD